MEAFAIPFLLLRRRAAGACRRPPTCSCRARRPGARSARRRCSSRIGAALLLVLAALVAGSPDALGGLDGPSRGTWSAASAARSTSPRASCCSRVSAPSLTVGLCITGQMLGVTAARRLGWLGVEAEPLGARRADAAGSRC